MNNEKNQIFVWALTVAIAVAAIMVCLYYHQSLPEDIYLDPGKKVVSAQVDMNRRLIITTRDINVDESPEVIQVFVYPERTIWKIHESR